MAHKPIEGEDEYLPVFVVKEKGNIYTDLFYKQAILVYKSSEGNEGELVRFNYEPDGNVNLLAYIAGRLSYSNCIKI